MLWISPPLWIRLHQPPSPNREISDRRIRGSPMSCAAGEAGVEAAAGLDCANGALC